MKIFGVNFYNTGCPSVQVAKLRICFTKTGFMIGMLWRWNARRWIGFDWPWA